MKMYILKNKIPVETTDVAAFTKGFAVENRSIAYTRISSKISVSTVFLGFDHNYLQTESDPVLFETMVFGGKHDGYQERYTTWKQAEAGHAKAVTLIKGR